jgi:hypothetical protein
MSREDEDDDVEEDDRKLPPGPSPKRKQHVNNALAPTYSPGQDFTARTVHQVTGLMVDGSPASQQAAIGVLENLSSSSNNISKTIVKSMSDRGSISIGMSQEIALKLLMAEKLQRARK